MKQKKTQKEEKKEEPSIPSTPMVTCDYCGEQFPKSKRYVRAIDEDFCVCPECIQAHEDYMESMGEREDKPDADKHEDDDEREDWFHRD